jgi:hypothetical protein
MGIMKKLLLLLLLISSFAQGQIPVISTTANNIAPRFTYVDFPAPLTYSDPFTLLYATTGIDVGSGEVGGKTELNIGSDYPQFIFLNQTAGFKMQSLDPTDPSTWFTMGGGGTLGAAAIRNSGANQPASIQISNIKATTNQSAVAWNPTPTPSPVTMQNMIMEDHSFAAVQINASVSSSSFGAFSATFCSGQRMEGEGYYLGNTGGELSAFTSITLTHDFIEDSGREPWQFQGTSDIRLDHLTSINAGLDAGQPANQRCDVQLINVKGYLKNSILAGGYNFATVEVNDFLFENCFFEASWSGATFFLGDMSDNGWTTFAAPGDTIIFRNCIFYNPNTLATTLFDIRENNCNIRFEGHNIFPASCTDIWDDNRASFGANTIVNAGTSEFTNTPPLPTFVNHPNPLYAAYWKVVSSRYYYDRKMGALTPD